MTSSNDIGGLSLSEVREFQKRFGKNIYYAEPQRNIRHIVRDLLKEPMFLLLGVACALYFLLGRMQEGFMMVAAVIIVSVIDIYQEVRSVHALDALKKYSAVKVKAIRDGALTEIASEEIVPGDLLQLEEGEQVPADAVIVTSNDLMVDESILTGESFAVSKDKDHDNNLAQGTSITTGACTARVIATGNQTKLGKLGKSIESQTKSRTPLQIQTSTFVRRMAIVGFMAFIFVMLVNYVQSKELISSLLFGLTLAMAIIPEEIPVAFSSFMAIGALRMAKNGIITRQPSTVESLGSASVICLDKTGTITENKMSVASIFDFRNNQLIAQKDFHRFKDNRVIEHAMWSSESNPYDAMEKAIHDAYSENTLDDKRSSFSMIHEYRLSGVPPMMTHVFQSDHRLIVATKGAPERVMNVCHLIEDDRKKIISAAIQFARQGFRVLGVASADHDASGFPENQDHFNWQFEGLIALYDPPKKKIREVIQRFYSAGVGVKIITGDFTETALTIATESGIVHNGQAITGDEVMNMSMPDLKRAVKEQNIFARVYPEAKLKVVNALKENGEVVAMTGDGVNDGPALKAAHIGVAMGKRGTEIAKRASSLVITDDDLLKMVEAIAAGRKIYNNLKKAIRYIIAIHIPIILTVLVPLLLNWQVINIFTPVHIIFFELIMGPTCSIFFENEPLEERFMNQKALRSKSSLFSLKELLVSMLQGLCITVATLSVYHFAMVNNYSEEVVRTTTFITIVLSNIMLTYANRSYSLPIFKTMFFKNNLAIPVVLISCILLFAILYIHPLTVTFELEHISMSMFAMCVVAAAIGVLWFEVYKTVMFFFPGRNSDFNSSQGSNQFHFQ